LLASPSGGIFVFWASASLLFLAACLLPLVRALRRRHIDLDAWPALVLAVVALGLIFTLASWWTLFGWLAWGPRLSLPWVLPLLLLAVVSYAEPLTALLRRLVTPMTRLLLVAVVFFLLTLPHIGYLWRPEATAARFFSQTDRACNPSDPFGSSRHYGCLHEQMWLRRPLFIDSGPGLRTNGALVTSIAVTLGLVGSLILLREETRPERDRVRIANPTRRHAAAAGA